MNTYLFLNSRDAISNDNSDVQWSLSWPSTHNDSYMFYIDNVSLPNVVYPVNQYYNTLNITDTGGTSTITLTSQNYTGSQLATEIQTKLNADATLAGTYSVSYDAQTFKLTIGSTVNYTINSGSAAELCGYTQLPTTSGTTSTSDSVVRLDGSQYVDLICSIGKSSYSTDGKTNVFYRIPLTHNIGSVQFYESSNDIGIKVQDSQLTSFNVRLLDDKGNKWVLPDNCYINLTIKLQTLGS